MQPNTLDLQQSALRLCEFHCALEAKEQKGDADKRIIRGYASTPAIDRYQDIVEPAAFKKTIGAFMKNGPILLHHDARKPVGNPLAFEIDDKGLWIEAEIATGIDPLDHKEQAWNEITQRLLRGLSIGFRILKDESVDPNSDEGKRGAQRRILAMELFEISVVTIPANRETMFSLGKALQFGSDLDFDLYGRNLWPDARALQLRANALELYWSGKWPDESVRALRSVDPPETVDDTKNEGNSRDRVEEATNVVRLATGRASLAASRLSLEGVLKSGTE